MPTVDHRLRAGQDVIEFFHDVIRWQAAGTLAEIHRPTARVESKADLRSRGDLGLENVAGVAGNDVVVVGGGRTSGFRQPREAAGGRHVDGVGVDTCPDGVQGGQPLEKRRVRGQASGDPLVEMMMCVDQTRRDQATTPVDHLRTRVFGWRSAPTSTILLPEITT